MFVLSNLASTTLASSISASATTLTLASSTNFPSSVPSYGYLPLILNDAATRTIYEIVYVTAISGTTLTVVRGQEGTAAQNWNVGDLVFSNITASSAQTEYAPDTGSGDSITIALSPAPYSLTQLTGVPLWVKKGGTANIGPTTVTVNGLATTSLILNSGAALEGGELLPGTLFATAYDGSQFQLLSPNVLTVRVFPGAGTRMAIKPADPHPAAFPRICTGTRPTGRYGPARRAAPHLVRYGSGRRFSSPLPFRRLPRPGRTRLRSRQERQPAPGRHGAAAAAADTARRRRIALPAALPARTAR